MLILTKNIYPFRRVDVAKSEVVFRPAVASAAAAAPAAEATPAPEEKLQE